MEEWRESRNGYQVSNLGRFRNRKGRMLKLTITDEGRALASYRDENGTARVASLPILVCESFHGPKPGPGYHVAHYDCNPLNNRIENLRWATPKENAADCMRNGCEQMFR